MMWLISGLMLVAAAGFICYRIFLPDRALDQADERRDKMNIALHREHAEEIADLHWSASAIEKQALMAEAQRQLLIDAEKLEKSPVSSRSGVLTLTGITALLIALAILLYGHLGAAEDVKIRTLLDRFDHGSTENMRTLLESRLTQRPDNFYYWLLLARLEFGNDQALSAVKSYRRALQLSPMDGNVAAELAQALFIGANNEITDETAQLVTKALELEPHNTVALELAGVIALSKGDYASTLRFWQRSLELTPAQSPNSQLLRESIKRVRSAIGESAEALLTLQIRLGKDFDDIVATNPDGTVFIYVQEWQGLPMPLAATRVTVADLPIQISFTDDMSLSATRKLSETDQLEVIARVANSDSLKAATGDIEGRFGPFSRKNHKDIVLIMDRRLP